jgi:hypothetical protein
MARGQCRPTLGPCSSPLPHKTADPMPILFRLAATAACMPCVRHNVEGDVLLQHAVTLAGCLLFLAQTRSRCRRPSVRHPATFAVFFVSIVSTICQVPKLVYYRSHRQSRASCLAVRRNAEPRGQSMRLNPDSFRLNPCD